MRTLRYKPSKCTNHSQSDHNILIVLITTRQSFKRQGTLLYDLVRKKCTMAFCSEGELLTLRDWLKTAESSLTLLKRSLHENYELREYRRDIYADSFSFASDWLTLARDFTTNYTTKGSLNQSNPVLQSAINED